MSSSGSVQPECVLPPEKPASAREHMRAVLSIVWAEASAFVRLHLAAVLGLVILAGTLTSLAPIALKVEVDRFTHPAPPRSLICDGAVLAFYIITQFTSRAITEARGLIYSRAERRMFRTLSERLFTHLMRLPLRYHLERQIGSAGQLLENGLQGYQMILHHLVFTVLPVSAELGTTIVILGRLARPEFLLLFCAALVCYAAAFTYAAMSTSKPAKRASATRIASAATMTDAILNCELLKSFAAEELAQEKVRRALLDTERESVDFFKFHARNGLFVAGIYGFFVGTTLLYAAYEVRLGQMTVGDFVLVNTYTLQLLRPVEMLGYAAQAFSQGMGMLDKMIEVLREPTESSSFGRSASPPGDGDTEPSLASASSPNASSASASSASATPAKLEFRGVSFSFESGRPLLRDVSFEIRPGEVLGLVGPSGAGKSTIARLVARLFEPKKGHILLDDVDISRLPLRALRRSIGIVSQDIQLLDDSVHLNICLGRPGSTRDEVEAAARVASLHEEILRMPQGYDTRIGERGHSLSGGQRQRLSIARAVLIRPRLVVFDEGTSQLDCATERQVERNLREISNSCTVLIIAHRLTTVARANQIVVLDQGTIVERGTHESLLRAGRRYASLWAAYNASSVAT
ncbi:MAG TPA: ABC transporter ATP-binding protein [Steroidobacteraceae bacterium]|nr:ABC transporter ATP-binding protein [Steroidobacteraceae bacterium]